MKLHRLVLLIILLMLFAVSAYATEAVEIVLPEPVEEDLVAESFKFIFRNGVVWGATIEEVQAAETGHAESDLSEDFEVLAYTDVSVSNYSADLFYVFHKGVLVSAFYGFDVLPSNDYDYLVAAISSKYDTPITPEASRQQMLMNVIDPGEYEVFKLTNWELDDGTYIALFSTDEEVEENFLLMYSNEEPLLLIGGIYNTAGL